MAMKIGMQMMIGSDVVGEPGTTDPGNTFLLEDGSGSILQEDGGFILSEDNP